MARKASEKKRAEPLAELIASLTRKQLADLWLRLAESREARQPADALAIYTRVADGVMVETDRRPYARVVRILKRARSAADAAGEGDDFGSTLDKAKLD